MNIGSMYRCWASVAGLLAVSLQAGEASSTAVQLADAQSKTLQIRIKDLAEIQGIRGNQLIGNGLVIGLDGTGDSGAGIVEQQLSNLITRFGVNIPKSALKSKNVAAVMVTATLPPLVRKGARIDVQVSSIGDAKSLQGGILVQTPLRGADDRYYAVAQGAVSVGGFIAGGGGGGGATVQKNHPVVGRIPAGAFVEQEVPSDFARSGLLYMRLRDPDFTTANRMAETINASWAGSSTATDLGGIEIRIPETFRVEGGVVNFISQLENLRVSPDNRSRVIINERTGTIVAGAGVRIAPTAISHGNLFITIKNNPVISQPNPFTDGKTVVVDDQITEATEERGNVIAWQPGPTLGELASALNALKLTPRDIMIIFQALKDAGALHAELIIM